MQCAFVVEILMVIEITEPLFLDARFWKSHELAFLRTGHPAHLPSCSIKSRSQVPWSKDTQASQPIPILVGYPSPGLWPGQTSVPLFSHAVFAVGLSSALNTSLRWLEHGDVLRSYEIFKVQFAVINVRGSVLAGY